MRVLNKTFFILNLKRLDFKITIDTLPFAIIARKYFDFFKKFKDYFGISAADQKIFMAHLLKLPLIFSGLICLASGCLERSNSLGTYRLRRNAWPQTEKLEFILQDNSPQIPINILYQVRTSNEFLYQNIWLKYWLIGPDKDTLTSSNDNLFLFEPSGKPIGTGTSDSKYVDAYFLKNIRLPKPGDYRIVVQHTMRADTLIGLQSIGLRKEIASEE